MDFFSGTNNTALGFKNIMFALQTICEKTLWQRKEIFTLIDYGGSIRTYNN